MWLEWNMHNIAYDAFFIAYVDLYATSELLPMIDFDSAKEKLIEFIRRAQDVNMENSKDWFWEMWR